jgi:hypothetical protein
MIVPIAGDVIGTRIPMIRLGITLVIIVPGSGVLVVPLIVRRRRPLPVIVMPSILGGSTRRDGDHPDAREYDGNGKRGRCQRCVTHTVCLSL